MILSQKQREIRSIERDRSELKSMHEMCSHNENVLQDSLEKFNLIGTENPQNILEPTTPYYS